MMTETNLRPLYILIIKGGEINMDRNKLEELREELYKVINKDVCLCNKNVVEISEKLDKKIMESMKVRS